MQAPQQAILLPTLEEGWKNGGVLFADGKPSHWVVLLPEEKGGDWDAMLEWARTDGVSDLPSPEEQSLLRATLPGEFKRDWYWSNKKKGSAYAWFTSFGYGNQGCTSRDGKFRARRVRRLPIQFFSHSGELAQAAITTTDAGAAA